MPCLNSVKNSRVNPPMSEPISPTNSTYCRTQTNATLACTNSQYVACSYTELLPRIKRCFVHSK